MVFSRDSTTEGIGEFPSRKSSTHDFFKTSPRFESWRERLHSTIFEKQYGSTRLTQAPRLGKRRRKTKDREMIFLFPLIYILLSMIHREIYCRNFCTCSQHRCTKIFITLGFFVRFSHECIMIDKMLLIVERTILNYAIPNAKTHASASN